MRIASGILDQVKAFTEVQTRLEAEGHEDEDPTATFEMLQEVGRLADSLEARIAPEPEWDALTAAGRIDDIPL